ncbi:hypothetical protein OGAPHI_004244 [Ogataea philodendri]|uniref:Amino acid permease/ SLC12A domain-containing protein n=1 Tax=Ogataea philodendri TaxID=1378263 RepID=A0A9P8P6Q2_9ASCO|nr:uncharacterized protein OGAPHI_004244 [Ogataea philodendri]KAH3666055.1 hypothetical protein OGAPHI_004244 [Ogataea philodendri]
MENYNAKSEKLKTKISTQAVEVISLSESEQKPQGRFISDGHTVRKLRRRHIDLISVGGSIGTALFVTIGWALATAGPGNLLVAFILHAFLMYVVTITIGELVCYLPVDSPFITHAGRFVDPALEVAFGYNFYLMMALYVPFELTSVNNMIHYWTEDYSPAATLVPMIAVYIILNVFAVKWYGESEFILSSGKIILATGLMFYTFITMLGGNPQHDRYGFRNFGSYENAFPKYLGTGASAFWSAYCKAIFSMAAPEYLGMVAGEAENPRKTMVTAFKTIVFRLLFFFVGGALCVGIVLNHNDPKLANAVAEGASGANVSPYVISMQNMSIKVLPDIVNVLCMLSSFSAGNSYMYCGTRSLFALAKRRLSLKIFTYTTRDGVPFVCLVVSTAFACLSLLELDGRGSTVLNWLINLTTGSQLINYFYMMIVYLGFYRACKAQGLDRSTLPLQSILTKWQPYPAIYGAVCMFIVIAFLGVFAFVPEFNIDSFLYYYLILFLNIVILVGWKLIMKSKMVDPATADLTSGLEEIEEHEAEYYEKMQNMRFKPDSKFGKVMAWLL